MAGQRLLILCGIGTFFVGQAFGQSPTPTAPPQNFPPGGRHQSGPGDATNSPEFENVRKALEALTPEQRKRFRDNFLRWSNLSPEERDALRKREDVRRQRMVEDVQHAIEQSGLQLDPARREQFTRRYAEERRKLEERLRKETEEKRGPEVQQIIARLKQEFSGTPVQ